MKSSNMRLCGLYVIFAFIIIANGDAISNSTANTVLREDFVTKESSKSFENNFVEKENDCSEKLHKCAETGGVCRTTKEENKFQCACADGAVYDSQIGCKVQNEDDCTTQFSKCVTAGGSCTTTKTENTLQCVCPEGATYDKKLGCKVTNDDCTAQLPKCVNAGGSCMTTKTENTFQCVCPEDATYDEKIGCKVEIEDDCTAQFSKCVKTGGSCTTTKAENTFQCVCPEGATYDENIGCKVENEDDCTAQFSKCVNAGGCCTTTKTENTFQCVCPEGATYDEKIGCKVENEDDCTTQFSKCVKTGGSCTATKTEKTFQCVCPEGATYDENIGCKVENEDDCTTHFSKCVNTGGSCTTTKTENIFQCVCPEGATYDEKKGCKVQIEDDCTIQFPKCVETGGSCMTMKEEDTFQCVCPEGSIHDREIGCKVGDYDVCSTKLHKCVETGGACATTKEYTLQCVCPAGTVYDSEVGCKVEKEEDCSIMFPKCVETGGSCTTTKEVNTLQCFCPDGAIYDLKIGCKVSKSTCIAKFPKCLFTGGICVLLSDKTIQCACPAGTTFDEENGCTVMDEFCNKESPRCLSTGGSCISKADNTLECVCPEGTTFNSMYGCEAANFCTEVCGSKPGIRCHGDLTDKEKIYCGCDDKSKIYDKDYKECRDDKCLEFCGIRYGIANEDLRCIGGPFENVVCECTDKRKSYDPRDKMCKIDFCKEKCGDVACEGDKFKEAVECKCDGHDEDFVESEKKCKVNYCKKICGTHPEIECDNPYEDKKDTKDCDCYDASKYFNPSQKVCQKQCSEDSYYSDCRNDGKCVSEGWLKFCKCVDGTTGDFCEIIRECDARLKNCKGERGKCVFEKYVATCQCSQKNTKFYEKVGYCEDTCSEEKECTSGRACSSDGFCECPEGHEGDDCKVVTGCKTLEKTCKEQNASCIFNQDARNMATCKCHEKGFLYDPYNKKCKTRFCASDPCSAPAQCHYDFKTQTGFCKCEEGQYYNYKKERCEELPDKCLLKKSACGEGKVCLGGRCVCAKGYEKEEKECKSKLCKVNPCFQNAECNETDGSCTCKEGTFYDGRRCIDAQCDWNKYETSCSCPDGMERKKDSEYCVPSRGETCDKNCGYGLCVRENYRDVCKCFKPFARNAYGTCLLSREVCASGILEKDSEKCNCSGNRYTQASDGITCRLTTCSEASAQKDCASQGATCRMRWKNEEYRKAGYYCECPKGYISGNGRCTDPCSVNKNIENCMKYDQFCYNSVSEINVLTADCKCPPAIEMKDGKCSKLAKHAYIIRNIPVLQKRYEMKSGINKVLLNADIIESMTRMFSEEIFDYGYLYEYRLEDGVLKCSVWIHFKRYPGSELRRISFQAKRFPRFSTCKDCDETITVLPPNLMLNEEMLHEIEYDHLRFCDLEVKNAVCGKYAGCQDNECFCPKGFKTIFVREYEDFIIQRCEDIDECTTDHHACPENTTCVNIPGDYGCVCKPGFKKDFEYSQTDKRRCYDHCHDNPCLNEAKCSSMIHSFHCTCKDGFFGERCEFNRRDDGGKINMVVWILCSVIVLLIFVISCVAFCRCKKRMREKNDC